MVAPWKTKEVDELAGKLKKAQVVGVVGVEGIPSKQLQKMRKQFGDKLTIRVSRNNVIKHAIAKAKIPEELAGHITGPSGLVFTDLSPFKLEKLLFDNKANAPAKAGSISPIDIVIPKGDTPFAPGPIIGELQAVGIKAKIEGGKIVVLKDSPVVSAGEQVSPEVASVLARFGIEPVEIGLHLQAALEGGVVYPGEVLHIDEAETLAKITNAYASALNVSLNAEILNAVTIPYYVRDLHVKAVNLAFAAGVYTKETLEFMIGKAEVEAKALNSLMPEEPAKEEASKDSKEEPAKKEKIDSPAKEEPHKEEKQESPGEKQEPAAEEKAEETKEEKPVGEKKVKEEAKPEEEEKAEDKEVEEKKEEATKEKTESKERKPTEEAPKEDKTKKEEKPEEGKPDVKPSTGEENESESDSMADGKPEPEDK